MTVHEEVGVGRSGKGTVEGRGGVREDVAEGVVRPALCHVATSVRGARGDIGGRRGLCEAVEVVIGVVDDFGGLGEGGVYNVRDVAVGIIGVREVLDAIAGGMTGGS